MHMKELVDCEFEEYDVVEVGEWIGDVKYEKRKVIFKFEGKDYMLRESRCGSYHTGYEHYFQDTNDQGVECPEVEKVEIKSYEWRIKE